MENYFNDMGITPTDEASGFETFCNYCVMSHEYHERFDVEDINVGSTNDTGLDGIAILINDSLIDSKEEIQNLLNTNGFLNVTFIFIQAKTSSGFDGGEILKFSEGVEDFFSTGDDLIRNVMVKHKAELAAYVIDKHSIYFKSKPKCKMYYITTGKWTDNHSLQRRFNKAKNRLSGMNIFDTIEIFPYGADEINRLYKNTKAAVATEIEFPNRVALPAIDGISESFVGTLPFKEFMKLITDDYGAIKSSIFYDNIRAFKGQDIPINQSIAQTLKTDKIESFVVLNNGITIVAKLKFSGGVKEKFTLTNYQIVNGCQTSHIIYENRHISGIENLNIHVKIIVTEKEDIINDIIKATNHQTEVTKEELLALSDFQKKLEVFYESYKDDPLYYERQSGQYNNISTVSKRRTVVISHQIKTFAAMFLDQPHRASRYYGELYKDVANSTIFSPSHHPIVYYTSARTYYVLENYFNRGIINSKYKKCKFHLLMILRYIVSGSTLPNFSHERKIQDYCNKILDVISDEKKCLHFIKLAINYIEEIAVDLEDREPFKTQKFTDELINKLKAPIGFGKKA
jgi:hypothetical protein